MSGVTHIRAICIPSNIVAIRTRAFYSIDYIWTTATNLAGTVDPEGSNTKLDNGAKLKDGTPVTALIYEGGKYKENPAFTKKYYTADYSTIKGGGTYTFGSNLRLIETGAFANTQPNVKDVYVLNTKAPECHVDAFNTVMYAGNNGYSPISDDQKIISRENYYNGRWITMLHYPRQTTTPDVQRYTDPTREYSIATGERDGKGATIYFPNQSEFIRAYMQGTYGYVWNAWNPTRVYGSVINGNLTNTTTGWSKDGQTEANALFDLYPSGEDHEYTSFYKVSNFTGETVKAPKEALVPYNQVNWNETSYSTAETGNLYPQSEKDAGSDVDKSGEMTTKDYRGWHQFVLNAYAANTVLKEEPYRSYITDNDWWTICMPFSLTRKEAIELFGTPGTSPLLPKVCRLQYVIRDLNTANISLYFSKNLLENTEGLGEYDANAAIKQHGTEDGNGVVTITEGTAPGDEDIVMAAGVPYLIKPNMTAGNNGKFNRQFRIYTSEDYDKLSEAQKNATTPKAIKSDKLYARIQASESLSGAKQIELVESGICKVPVFVTKTKDSRVGDENNDGETYTINSKEYAKSTAFHYSFVGTFYKSFMPQYSYYLGWNSTLKKAQFFFKTSPKENIMTWINETGVIVPTTSEFSTEVQPAAGKEPAQWVITGANDAFTINNQATGAKAYNMVFDAPEVFAANGEVTGIDNINANENVIKDGSTNVYTVSGQKVGTSLEGLPKGIYIVNGKKFIVK